MTSFRKMQTTSDWDIFEENFGCEIEKAKSVRTLEQFADFLNEDLEHNVFFSTICKKNGWTISRKKDRICYDPKNNSEIACVENRYKVFKAKETIDNLDDVKRMIEIYMRPYQGNEIPLLGFSTDGKLRYFERWWHTSPVFECDIDEIFALKKSDFNRFIADKIVENRNNKK